MRVLITGATGLIGGRLVRFLLEKGDVQVRAGSRTARAWPEGVEGCVAEIGRPESLPAALEGVDAVINLSSVSERRCSLEPAEALRVNAGGALALATAARDVGVPRFVQVSTYKVYGNCPNGVVTEETPCRPSSHYAITHRTAEDYARMQHPCCVVFRVANGFGAPVGAPPSAWDVLANEFCRDTVLHGAIAVRSSGLSWRNFVPMADIVGALHAGAVGLPAGTYNLGAPGSMTLRDLAARVARMSDATLGVRPEVTFGPVEVNEVHPPLDFRIDRLAAAGFCPTASLDDELRETLISANAVFGVVRRG
jgi:UDP-glucose 4-epimerase